MRGLDAPGEGGEGGEQQGGLAEEDGGDDDEEAGGTDGALEARAGVDKYKHVCSEVRQHGVEPGEGKGAIELRGAAVVQSEEDFRRVEGERGDGFLRRDREGELRGDRLAKPVVYLRAKEWE